MSTSSLARHTGREPTSAPPPKAIVVQVALIMVAAIAVVSAVGLVVVHVLDDTAIGRFDLHVVRDLASDRTPTMNRITGWITWLSDTVPVAVLWIGLLVVTGVATRRWVAPLFVMVAIGGEKLSYFVASVIVGRDRPPVPPLGTVHATHSFPSGHTGAAVTVYGSILLLLAWGHLVRHRAVLVAGAVGVALITVAVAFARMYRGHHYPTDVVAGAMLGAAWLWVAWVLVLRDRPYEPAHGSARMR